MSAEGNAGKIANLERALSRRRFLTGAAALPVLFTPAISRAQTLRIGAVLPLSGNLSRFGSQARLGLDLAAEQINEAGGILGERISIDYRDDAANPARAEVAARSLTSDPDVVAIAGPVTSASRNAVSATMVTTGTPLLYATDYEGGDCGKTLFYFNSVPNQSAEPLMRFLMDEAGTRAYLLGADYIWPHAMFDACAKVIGEEGGTVAGRRFVPLAGLSDYDPVLSDIRASDTSVLVLALPGDTHQEFMAAAGTAGILQNLTIGNLGAVALYGSAQYDGIAAYGCAPFIETDASEAAQAFVALARRKAGSDATISAYAATHYNALNALKLACERSGSVSRDAIAAGLAGLEYDTPSGSSMIDAATRHSTLAMGIARATAQGPQLVKPPVAIAPQASCITGG
ncbi:MAG: ABC transporter substrate-binding protein [Pseudomonadota bacterium]